MFKYKLLAIVMVCICFYMPLSVIAGSERDSIQNTFKIYKKALKIKNGFQAVSLVSTGTIEYYEDLRKNLLNAKAIEVKRLPITKKVAILSLRLRISASELRQMNGKKLFIHSVSKGWVSKDSIKNVELGDIKVNGNAARANIVSKGRKRKFQFPFSKEKGVWKLDLATMMNRMEKDMNTGLKRLAKMRKMSEQDMVVFLVEGTTGLKVTSALWSRPRN